MGRHRNTRREPAEQVRAVALAARKKRMDGLLPHVADPLAGSVMGLLCLRWRMVRSPGSHPPVWAIYSITAEHYDAGTWYAGRVRAHASVMGYSIDRLKSPGFGLVAGGIDCKPELDEDRVAAIKADFRDAYRVLMDCGNQVAMATYDLCLDRLTMPEAESAIIPIKVGLTALGKMRRGALAKSPRRVQNRETLS